MSCNFTNEIQRKDLWEDKELFENKILNENENIVEEYHD